MMTWVNGFIERVEYLVSMIFKQWPQATLCDKVSFIVGVTAAMIMFCWALFHRNGASSKWVATIGSLVPMCFVFSFCSKEQMGFDPFVLLMGFAVFFQSPLFYFLIRLIGASDGNKNDQRFFNHISNRL